MPIISKVGRRSLKVRLLIASVYTVLILGSISMVYPFVLMISGSFKSAVDMHVYDPVPKFFYDDLTLFRKFVEEKYQDSAILINRVYRTEFARTRDVTPPAVYSKVLLEDWRDYCASDCWRTEFPRENGRLPLSFFVLGCYYGANYKETQLHQRWIHRLIERFGTEEAMNEAWGTDVESFLRVYDAPEAWDTRRFTPEFDSPLYRDLVEFKQEIREHEPRFIRPVPVAGHFVSTYLVPKYSRYIDGYNKSHGTRLTAMSQLRLTEAVPPSPQSPAEWEAYVADDWRIRNVRLRPEGEEMFKAFLLDQYGSFASFADAYGFEKATMGQFEVPFPIGAEDGGPIYRDFRAFLSERVPWRQVYLQDVEDWEWYVREEIHIQNVWVTPAGITAFKTYLQALYTELAQTAGHASPLDAFAGRYGREAAAPYATLEDALVEFEISRPVPLDKPVAVDFKDFIRTSCPLSEIRLVTHGILFARFLERR
ncbi:MAG TPA: hypothetical protein HPP77_07490, partial [Candidatus Hydrogenedentes bacterium]|nr:hypothetical protein [Candidatus Hydrogenedentota bacterium]